MKFLLLLSAMLSALTGVVTAGRAVAPQAVSRGIGEAAAARAPRPAVSAAPRQALPLLHVNAHAPADRGYALRDAEPLFASRRRE